MQRKALGKMGKLAENLTAGSLIMEAFLRLLKEKPFTDITVHEIAGKAGISRSVFYLHFEDKDDVFQKVSGEIIGEFLQLFDSYLEVEERGRAGQTGGVLQAAGKICHHIRDYHFFYQEGFRDLSFITGWAEHIFSRLQRIYNDQAKGIFVAYGLVGCMNRWISEGAKGSPKERARQFVEVFSFLLDVGKVKGNLGSTVTY